ncbi:MAG: hypothetical protein RLZZ143_3797, partial [Cyanobacteriota bacterium]
KSRIEETGQPAMAAAQSRLPPCLGLGKRLTANETQQ